jgi:heme oxygenase
LWSDPRPGGPDYARLVQLLHSLHTAADPLLVAWVKSSRACAHLSIPLRASGFASDLAALGVAPLPALSFTCLPRTAAGTLTDPAGIGLLYVVAGSSLGARVLLRNLSSSVPLQARAGLEHGASPPSVQLWAAVITLLARPAPAADAVSGASACSSVFEALLAVSTSEVGEGS